MNILLWPVNKKITKQLYDAVGDSPFLLECQICTAVQCCATHMKVWLKSDRQQPRQRANGLWLVETSCTVDVHVGRRARFSEFLSQ